MTKMVGLERATKLGRYEMLAPIASGGMASVWAARLLGVSGFRKIVAIKAMLPDLADEPEYRTMFLDEARVASKLRHPNVCETFDLGEENGELFMAMEWVDGTSLHRLLRGNAKSKPGAGSGGRAIAPELAARIIAMACAGLHAAHEAVDDDGTPLAIVHRDMSPHNLLLSVDGHVKVTDFGIAKAVGKKHTTIAGQAKGKLAYMAPEQLRCAPVDRRADVFALGCVLYESTTGRKAFDQASDLELMRAILDQTPPKPSTLVNGYPRELEKIIDRAMAKDPNDRFASAEGLRLALERFLAGRGVTTERDIAALVHERCGTEIETRRATIHASCIDLPAIEEAPKEKPDRGRQLTIALGIGVIALAFGSLFIHRSFAIEETKPRVAQTIGATAPVETATRSPVAEMPARVTFHLDPPDATLIIDGDSTDSDDGTIEVERPAAGEMRVVLVKAPGRIDRLLVVDGTTPPTVEVSLASLIDKSSVL